ncbi:hypothetical protein B1A87_005225 [Arthrobacter sp. KBS0703]|uniref:hypothetical protein n=1 Tax=Arthrobacter sp. KBS0703 TaxID=1955698 RepID=UPI00098F3CC1|nr:hypothetical protein [Arthrobacter sp. KBS0703]TSE15398.1 hypothetical protein B1A87_005225 [Arthrobacter sp. KBS0703]
MTTLTLTADTVTTSILLEIALTSSVTKITRIDVNGTNDVRVKDYQLPSAASGKLILSDYEAANGINTYAVYTAAGTVTASAVLTLATPWFLIPRLPNFSAKVQQLTDYSSSRKSLSVAHDIIGRPDPVLALGGMGTRRGQLEIWMPDYPSAAALEDVFNRQEVAMLKQSVPKMDMFFIPETLDVVPYTPQGQSTCYRFTVNFRETKRPTGSLRGAIGWTFEELAVSFASFNEVAAAYATFDDLLLQREV